MMEFPEGRKQDKNTSRQNLYSQYKSSWWGEFIVRISKPGLNLKQNAVKVIAIDDIVEGIDAVIGINVIFKLEDILLSEEEG